MPDTTIAAELLPQMVRTADLPADNEPLNLYLLIDGARSMFLPERLELSGLEHSCLFARDHLPDDGASAPWLVKLDPAHKFAMSTFANDSSGQDPRAMFGTGVWITSHLNLVALRAHLRRYTQLTDERGATEYFRLAEPGMIDALLYASDDAIVSTFFSGVSRLYYPWPELEEGRFSILSVAKNQERVSRTAVAEITPWARKVLSHFVTDRIGRRIALANLTDPQQRLQAYPIFTRILRAGFDHEPRLIETFELLKLMPEEGHAPFWVEVESGAHSLRRILLVYRDHYQIKGVLE